MIDRQIFAQQMSILADRIGRALAGPTQVAYFEALSAELTTEEFVAAARLVFRDETWWPAPRVFVEKIRPPADPQLAAQAAFEHAVTLIRRHGWQYLPAAVIDGLDAPTRRAVGAVGGWRAIAESSESDWPHLRRRFEEAHRAANAESRKQDAAHVALEQAEDSVQALVGGVLTARSLPPGRTIGRPAPRSP